MELIIALFARILSNPLANMLQKKGAVFESSFTINFYSSLFMLVFLLPLSLNINFSSYSPNFYFLVFTSGLFCFLGTISLIKALSIGEMSVLGPINSYKSAIGLIGAFLFLKEIPEISGLIGFLIIISASFFFLDEEGKFILNKSVLLRILALIFTGIEAVILKKIIILSSPMTCLFFWVFTGFLFSFLAAFIFKKVKFKRKNSLFSCLTIAILLLVMQFSTNYIFKHLEVGLSLSLFQLSSIVSLFIGYKVFLEKNMLKKSIGTMLMLLGSILILK